MNLLNQLVKYGDRLSPDIQKAVGTVTEGGALTAQRLREKITNTIVHISPELYFIMQSATGPEKRGAEKYEFDKIISLPRRVGAVGANAATQRTGSKFIRDEVYMKIIRRVSRISGFLDETTRGTINTPEREYENHLKAHGLDMVYHCYFGNVGANPREFDGFDRFVQTNRIPLARGGEVPTDLQLFSDALARSNEKGGLNHRRAFILSPTLWFYFNNLISYIRVNNPAEVATLGTYKDFKFNAHWEMVSFMGIPILQSGWTKPREKMSSTVTPVKQATGGSLSDGTYYIQIAPVTTRGEQIASDEVSVTLDAGTAVQSIKVTLDAPHLSRKETPEGEDYNDTYQYRIYMSTTSQSEKLSKIVSAFVYDVDGQQLSDENGTAGNDIIITGLIDTNTVNSAQAVDIPYLAEGLDVFGAPINPAEGFILWDFDQAQGLGDFPFTNIPGDAFEGMVYSEVLGKTDDFVEMLFKSYMAMANAYEGSSVYYRGVKRGN